MPLKKKGNDWYYGSKKIKKGGKKSSDAQIKAIHSNKKKK